MDTTTEKNKKIEHLEKSMLIALVEELFQQIKIDYGLTKWTEQLLLSFVEILSRGFQQLTMQDLFIAFKINTYGELDRYMGRRNNNVSFNLLHLNKVVWAYKSYKGGSDLQPVQEKDHSLDADINHELYLENLIEYYDLWFSNEKIQIRTPYWTAKYLSNQGLIKEEVKYNPATQTRGLSLVDETNSNLILKAFSKIRDEGKHLRDYLFQQSKMPF